MAHRADSIKEPSYNTLANIAEILGTVVYNSPALASEKKLENSSLPETPQFELGVVTDMYGLGSGRGPQPIYTVRLDSGAVIEAHSISGDMYGVDYIVAVIQDTGGVYTIISGGDEKYQSKDHNTISQFGSKFEYHVTDNRSNPKIDNTFQAFDTKLLMKVIGDLIVWISDLQEKYNAHTHAIANGVATATPLQCTTTPDLQQDRLKYTNSHTDKFQINY
jgi:hypothetical protein